MTDKNPMIDTHYGFVNAWETDENDHLNVQFFASAFQEANAHLRLALSLPSTNHPQTSTIIRISNDHIRFHAELREAESFVVHSGILDVQETNLTIYHELRTTPADVLSTTMVSVWQQVDENAQPKHWSSETIKQAKSLLMEQPKHAEKRSAGVSAAIPDIALNDAEPTTTIYKGIIHSEDCDSFGEATSKALFARFSNGGSHLWNQFGMNWFEMQSEAKGSVVVENFLDYRRPLHFGDPVTIKSFIRSVANKSLGFSHMVFNAETGALCVLSEATVILFDQKARKATSLTNDERLRFEAALWDPNK